MKISRHSPLQARLPKHCNFMTYRAEKWTVQIKIKIFQILLELQSAVSPT